MRYISKKEFDSRMRKIQLKNEQIQLRNKLRKERNKYRRKKKMNTSTKVLISIILAIVLYTIACLYIQHETSVEVSSTLTTLWFSFWTVEIIALTGIKISNIIKGRNTSDEELEESFEE